MADYSKVLEYIKASEARVSTISKSTKEVETEIKTLDGEIEIMRAKEKQLKDELSYKRKMVDEKEWEFQNLKNTYEVWANMLEEKRNNLDIIENELRCMQQNVWDTRISFYDNTMDFLNKNDILLNNDGLENIIKKKQEKNKLSESVKALEMNLNITENIHTEIKGRYDLLSHLEKEREILLEYEQTSDIKRLQCKIDSYNSELECIELEMTKYSDRAAMTSHEVVTKKSRLSNEAVGTHCRSENSLSNKPEIQEGSFEHLERKHPFKPKVPSFLLEKNFFSVGKKQKEINKNVEDI
ncbi:unnamed protein product [Nezara viridula]|uniref:Uncharacterized protein n=1 Tax=Nezara viridula TaxID=85310 RepID=A0A9P0HCK4_NEZVI|nr:unnamed protein product [Nezara viridula]